jgi:hypothetical protein
MTDSAAPCPTVLVTGAGGRTGTTTFSSTPLALRGTRPRVEMLFLGGLEEDQISGLFACCSRLLKLARGEFGVARYIGRGMVIEM